MYPGTIFEIIDQSQISTISTETQVTPLFLQAFAAPKGPEDLTLANSSNFYKLYGSDIDFNKYGQPLLQAAAIVEAGGTVLAKRVVSNSATLANIAIYAKVETVTDDTTADGSDEPVAATSKAKLTFFAKQWEGITGDLATATSKSFENAFEAVCTEAEKLYDADNGVYPLFVITDNARGLSKKRFRISPDYVVSKYSSYMRYVFEVIENNTTLESFSFALDPDVVEATNKSLTSVMNAKSVQLKSRTFDNYINEMYEKIADSITDIAALREEKDATYEFTTDEKVAYLRAQDLIFGKTKKQRPIPELEIVTEGEGVVNLGYMYGLSLNGGSNGAFGGANTLFNDEYNKCLEQFFDGTFTKDIYDRDNYKIDIIADANYPASVKRAIENFVIFREDCMYLRDMGTGMRPDDNGGGSHIDLQEIINDNWSNTKSKFCATYHNYYDIINPYTKKQITVTITYSIAKILCRHFLTGRSRPTAGILYGFTIPEAIEGTINFIPAHTPEENQKEILDDERINYASYYDGVLTVETLYTSQDNYTQLSFINNMLAIQEVIKAVRSRCPYTRYSFISGEDLSVYKADVEDVLNKYSSNFKSLALEYISDESYIQNKIFYAAIKVTFKDFVQTEWFKLYALS